MPAKANNKGANPTLIPLTIFPLMGMPPFRNPPNLQVRLAQCADASEPAMQTRRAR
jgi:hypothetical protein